MAEIWTHGRWTVKSGREAEFVTAWREFAEWSRSEFGGTGAMILRDRDDPRRYFSFGAWQSVEDVERWRGSGGFQERLGAIREMLEEVEVHTLERAGAVGSLA